jgi:hypothetical protein
MKQEKETRKKLPYQIVRTYSAGVFAGHVVSQLAMEGVSKPDECRFPRAVDRVELLQAIEILDVTEKARKVQSKIV